MNSYDADTDTIDFSKAARATVARKLMLESAYLPINDGSQWMADVAAEDTAALVTKLSSDDAAILHRLAESPRLGSIVKVVYKRRSRREAGSAQANAVEEIPHGANRAEWEPYVMLAYGIKLGGSRAIVPSGFPSTPEPPQGYPEQSVRSSKSRLRTSFAQDRKLLPKRQVFQEEIPARAKESGSGNEQKPQQG
jgi:hypothetical protein